MPPMGGLGASAGQRKGTRSRCRPGPLWERWRRAQAQAEGEGWPAGVHAEGDGPARKQANQAESWEEKKGKFIFLFQFFQRNFKINFECKFNST